MLVLKRNESERILIGENIAITLVRGRNGSAKIGIDAPPDVRIWREELVESAERGAGNAEPIERSDAAA